MIRFRSFLAICLLLLGTAVFAHANHTVADGSKVEHAAQAPAGSVSAAGPDKVAGDALKFGAGVYVERCALCHGSRGLGEGPLPLMVQDYPDTNLRDLLGELDSAAIRDAIRHGGSENGGRENGGSETNNKTYSPPWESEFSEQEIEAVAKFVTHLGTDYEAAIELIDTAEVEPKLATGRKIYQARCQRCHGQKGRGDGPILTMRNIKLHSDLTETKLPYESILKVITDGGVALGRSPTMPPWGQELADAELASIAKYVQSLARPLSTAR